MEDKYLQLKQLLTNFGSEFSIDDEYIKKYFDFDTYENFSYGKSEAKLVTYYHVNISIDKQELKINRTIEQLYSLPEDEIYETFADIYSETEISRKDILSAIDSMYEKFLTNIESAIDDIAKDEYNTRMDRIAKEKEDEIRIQQRKEHLNDHVSNGKKVFKNTIRKKKINNLSDDK